MLYVNPKLDRTGYAAAKQGGDLFIYSEGVINQAHDHIPVSSSFRPLYQSVIKQMENVVNGPHTVEASWELVDLNIELLLLDADRGLHGFRLWLDQQADGVDTEELIQDMADTEILFGPMMHEAALKRLHTYHRQVRRYLEDMESLT